MAQVLHKSGVRENPVQNGDEEGQGVVLLKILNCRVVLLSLIYCYCSIHTKNVQEQALSNAKVASLILAEQGTLVQDISSS